MSTNTNGPTSTGSTLPTDVFEGLFPALVNVIVAVNSEEQESLTHKQAVAIAVCHRTIHFDRINADGLVLQD